MAACAKELVHLWRARRAVRQIEESGLFDPAWYARGGAPPGSTRRLIWHYVLRGAAEGRSPSKDFDSAFYLHAHPQIGLSGWNPLAHYAVHGRKAGLLTRPANPSVLPRQKLTSQSYWSWLIEMKNLEAPAIARLQERADTLPPLSIAGDGGELGRHVLLLPATVGLAEDAVPRIRAAIAAAPETELFYADEDCIGAGGEPAPWFKPDFDPELLQAGDLLGPASVMQRGLLERLGWDGVVPDAAGLRRLTLRAAGLKPRIGHIPRILFHRGRPAALDAVPATPPAPPPLVSVIMATRDHAALLEVAALGVLEKTAFRAVELLIIDNGSTQRATHRLLARLAADSRVRVLPSPGPFNWSALNNLGAHSARGDILVFLNNDVEIVSAGWLTELVAQAMRPDVGAVGAKLLYPDGTIQHAGMTLDNAGCFCHALRGAAADDPGMLGEMGVVRSVAAVTGACLAIRREVFFAVGGLEETVLAVTCNDIDLCLRVRDAGYRVVYTPHAVLVHHEAASRGQDLSEARMARVIAERDYLRRRWGDLATRDPYLNPNLCLLDGRPALEAPAALCSA